MAFFVLDSIRFLKTGCFEFEQKSKADAAKWICSIPSWKYQITDDTEGELIGMVNRSLNPTDRLHRDELVELGENDQALLIYTEPALAPTGKETRVSRQYRYGVLRGARMGGEKFPP